MSDQIPTVCCQKRGFIDEIGKIGTGKSGRQACPPVSDTHFVIELLNSLNGLIIISRIHRRRNVLSRRRRSAGILKILRQIRLRNTSDYYSVAFDLTL
nr:hypothetical protein [Bradyrhizobium canariense]